MTTRRSAFDCSGKPVLSGRLRRDPGLPFSLLAEVGHTARTFFRRCESACETSVGRVTGEIGRSPH